MTRMERIEALGRALIESGRARIIGGKMAERLQALPDDDPEKESCPADCVSGCAYCGGTGVVFGESGL